MKKLLQYFPVAVVNTILFISLSANAQHRAGSEGGGGSGSSSPAPASSPAPSQSSGSSRQSSQSQSAPSRSAPSQTYSRSAPSQNYTRSSSGTPHVAVSSYNYNGHTYYQNQRSGVSAYSSGHAGAGTRSYGGSVYGHTHASVGVGGVNARVGYLPGHAYYRYNRGYYNSIYARRLGYSVGFLAGGYYPFWFGDDQYYYSDGYYYQYNDYEYTVVEPPVGAEITSLPSNAQSIVINGQQYYEANGVYYEPITKDDGTLSYQVAGKDGELNTDDQGQDNGPASPQMGDIIQQLPPNCRKINMNGDKLYLSPDGVYYKAVLDQDNNKVYKIVGLPADDDQQPQPQQNGD